MKHRLPRKGDRVRFWVSDRGTRSQVEVTVLRRRHGQVEFRYDGETPGFTRITPVREMDIL